MRHTGRARQLIVARINAEKAFDEALDSDSEEALEEATSLMAGTARQAGKGRPFGLAVRALADVTSALAALSPPEITDARETE